MNANKKRPRKRPELSERATKVALAFDTLPLVAQDHVVEIINTLIRVRRDDEPVARLLWSRADPKRVRLHMRKIERYQATNRKIK